MEVKAVSKYMRMSSVKMAPVAKLIRGKKLADAETILKFKTGKAAEIIEKTLASAAANAENNNNLDRTNLYVKEIIVTQGPTLKRWRAGARGSAARILKRTSHVFVLLDEIDPSKSKTKDDKKTKAVKTPAPDKKTVADKKPAPDKKPAADKKSTAETKPAPETKPDVAPTDKPAPDKKPDADKKPAAEKKPTTTRGETPQRRDERQTPSRDLRSPAEDTAGNDENTKAKETKE